MGFKQSFNNKDTPPPTSKSKPAKPPVVIKTPAVKAKPLSGKDAKAASKEVAYDAIRDHMLVNHVDNFSELCRDYGLVQTAVRARRDRQDWPTVDAVISRKEMIIKSVMKYDCLYRPKGTTECDEIAIAEVRAEGMAVSVIEAESPEDLEHKASGPAKGTKYMAKSKEMKRLANIEVSRLASEEVSGTGGEVSTTDASPSPPPESAAVALKDAHLLAQLEQQQHDIDVARIARAAMVKALKLKTISITKIGDLRVVDDLYRRATHQKAGAGAVAPVVNVSFLQRIGDGSGGPVRHESVRIPTSDLPSAEPT